MRFKIQKFKESSIFFLQKIYFEKNFKNGLKIIQKNFKIVSNFFQNVFSEKIEKEFFLKKFRKRFKNVFSEKVEKMFKNCSKTFFPKIFSNEISKKFKVSFKNNFTKFSKKVQFF